MPLPPRKTPARTPPGITFCALYLRSLGHTAVPEHRFHPVRAWRFDLALPELKIAIEYQGHGTTGKKKHVGGHGSITGLSGDCEKDLHAQLHGWLVLKFTVFHFDPRKTHELKLSSFREAIDLALAHRSAGPTA